MIIGFTGHRQLQHNENKIAQQLIFFLKKMKPDRAISGMALGFDQLAARVCVYLNIPFIAALPTKDQANFWPNHAVIKYEKILSKANKIIYVDTLDGYHAPNDNFVTKLFNRNHWIVDHSNKIIAYYLNTGHGGTAGTVSYAYKQRKIVIPVEIR